MGEHIPRRSTWCSYFRVVTWHLCMECYLQRLPGGGRNYLRALPGGIPRVTGGLIWSLM